MRRDLALGAAILVIALAAKLAYSRAAVEDLGFVLAPTAAVVAAVTGEEFALEEGFGWFSRRLEFAIVASCAGVNFLIVAFCSLAWCLRAAAATWARAAALLGGCAALSWLLAVAANSVRIAVAIQLHQSGASLGWLDPSRLHRVTGIAVYLLALLAAVEVARRLEEARRALA